jgi:beta-xylosidase
MKISFIFLISLLIIIKCDNPLAQTVYTSDPAPMVYKDVLYVYTGHDADSASYFEMPDYQLFSTTDMQNWENHGTILSATDFSWAQAGTAWASQCIERNGKFYYYVTVTNGGGRNIAVAVGDSPKGPFKDALGKPLAGPNWDYIDPTVFIDDDNQAYLFWGNPSLYYVKLNDDMISYSGQIVKTDMTQDAFGVGAEGKTLYTEGPWFYKRGNLYYMVYAASGIPETIAYSTSSNPTGPWKHRGIIMGNKEQGGAFTNHPGVIDYKGRSYFFYHNARLPGGGGFDRSVAVEEFTYNADGTFPTIKMSNEGPKQIEYLDPFKKTKATVICFESGVEIEKGDNGEVHVAYIENGDYIKIKGADFKDGAKHFIASVSSDGNGGKIEIRLDKKDGNLAGTCNVANTGGWQNWETIGCDITGAQNVHDIYFVFTGGSGYLFNFDWWQFE